mmetsp:Transcript_20260/g.19577  ORF Transcript_20260/g.19577 Transcript_20260/m.19577 type:complete len:589 (+) Transcript_20260:317-2083(+)
MANICFLVYFFFLFNIGQHNEHAFTVNAFSCSNTPNLHSKHRRSYINTIIYGQKNQNDPKNENTLSMSSENPRLTQPGFLAGSTTEHAIEQINASERDCDLDDEDCGLDLPFLEIVKFDAILNFRSALPGTGLPIYRCAALDNATAADTDKLLMMGLMKATEDLPSISIDQDKDAISLLPCTGPLCDIFETNIDIDNDGIITEIKNEDVKKKLKPQNGLNIRTIIDLRNTDEILLAYKYRSYTGAISLYSCFKNVLDTSMSLKMRSRVKTYYSKSFDSVIRDLYYNLPPPPSGIVMAPPVPPKPRPLFRKVFELPLFGDSEEFWEELREITIKDGRSSLLADFRWLFNPNALSKQLTENLALGGLPLLYEVMLEVSAQRIASALFLCLVVCEDYASSVLKLDSNEVEIEKKSLIDERTGSTYAGGVLFHCAQGKDRTGILAMLLTFALYGDTPEVEERAVREYAASAALLKGVYEGYGDSEAHMSTENDLSTETNAIPLSKSLQKQEEQRIKQELESKSNNLSDIGSLKGSPPQALTDTIKRIRDRYGGSVLGYLDYIGFTEEYRERLQRTAETVRNVQKLGIKITEN